MIQIVAVCEQDPLGINRACCMNIVTVIDQRMDYCWAVESVTAQHIRIVWFKVPIAVQDINRRHGNTYHREVM